MWFLQKALESIALAAGTRKTKVRTHKSLKAIMEAVDFHVYRYRKRTGVALVWARGGSDEQRQYQDSMIINMPKGYKMYAFNIDQFLQKLNTPKSTKADQTGNQIPTTLPSIDGFSLKRLPSVIISDLGITQQKDGTYVANKKGYAAWIELAGIMYPLRKTKYEGISLHGTASKKMIYREKRDGSLEDSFIKVLGAYIASTVVDPSGTPLIKLDIDPAQYIPQPENSEDWENVSRSTWVPVVDTELSIPTTEIEIKSLNSKSQKDIWKKTNRTSKVGVLSIEGKDLAKIFGEEPQKSTDANFAWDPNKDTLVWNFQVGEGAITIYDWNKTGLEGNSFAVGANVSQGLVDQFLAHYKLTDKYQKQN